MNDRRKDEGIRLAAPAPIDQEVEVAPALDDEQRDLDDLCERYMNWRRTRRYYGPAPEMGSVLGQLSGSRTRPVQSGGPDAIVSAEMAAMHLAYSCQPDGLDKRVFDMYYVHRITPIKRAAAALRISRSHFYLVLGGFRQRLHAAAVVVMELEQRRLQEMERSRMDRAAPSAE